MRRSIALRISVCAALLATPFAAHAASAAKATSTPLDWNVSLRGQYTADGTGGHYEVIVAPELDLSFGSDTGGASFKAGGEFSVDDTQTVRVDQLHVGEESQDAFDENTSLTHSVDLTLEQLNPSDTSLPANTAIGPIEFTGTAKAAVRRDFEPLYIKASGTLERFIEGETTLDDSSTIDNTSKNYWLADGALRLGFELSPMVSVFVDGEESYQKFDAPDPTALAYLDGTTTTLKAGIAASDENYFSAEASIGEAWHDYLDGTLIDRGTWIYDANVTYTPDDTLSLGAAVTTSIGPSTLIAGDTDVGTTVSANTAVKVGEGVTLRGSASWNQAVTQGTGDVSNGYSVGTGLDYAPTPQTVWSADYLVTHAYAPPGPATDSQSVTLGLRIAN